MNTLLLYVDLIQSILIFGSVLGLFYVKDATPKCPALDMIHQMEEIPPKMMKELDELKEEASDVYKNCLDGIAEYWRAILGGGAVLLTLVFLGLLILILMKKGGKKGGKNETTFRHLLDLTEEERWRYIEAMDKGDLEEQMKILEVCGCGCENECGCKHGAKCSDEDCDCQRIKDEKMKMIKTEKV